MSPSNAVWLSPARNCASSTATGVQRRDDPADQHAQAPQRPAQHRGQLHPADDLDRERGEQAAEAERDRGAGHPGAAVQFGGERHGQQRRAGGQQHDGAAGREQARRDRQALRAATGGCAVPTPVAGEADRRPGHAVADHRAGPCRAVRGDPGPAGAEDVGSSEPAYTTKTATSGQPVG